jgi:hypothetical protein
MLMAAAFFPALCIFALAGFSPGEAATRRIHTPPPPAAEDQDLPEPPIPPADAPVYSEAPMPNAANTWAPAPTNKTGPQLAPGLFGENSRSQQSSGYLDGSTMTPERDDRSPPPAGFRLNMPLQ